MIKKRREAGIIQQCHPKFTSRIKSMFFHNKPRDQFESALYRLGHGRKSVLWYWEIDYKLGHYREFRTTDLAEGEKSFQTEDFASWPPDWQWPGGEQV